MKKVLLLLSLYAIDATAGSPKKKDPLDKIDLERKISVECKEIELSCSKCDNYVLTYKRDKSSVRDLLFWDAIIKPALFVADKNLGSVRNIPIWSIAAMRCPSCLEVTAEPLKYRIGDIERIAFKLHGFKRRSQSR